ncbi:MAG: hypothetical protein K2F91_09010, partial [Muribaculaceae bacterium]|nr:hypothetical protein [Muribaculaceae bacterium]
MKKFMMGACALLALAATSCDKCADGNCDTSTNDSLSVAYGDYVGSMLYSDYAQFDDTDKNAKQEFLRGMQIVFGADDSRNTRMGMQVALQMMAEMQQLEHHGVELNKAATMTAFKQAFLADSISFEQVQVRAAQFQALYTAAQEKARAAKEAEKAAEPTAVENGKAGNEYVESLKAEGKDVKTTDSGLSYIIENEGEGAKPEETSTVIVNYTGKHINGEVFDSTDGRGPATFNLQGVVP